MVTQALAAVWFYRLFRSVDSFAAGCLAAFGLVNAVVILGSAVFLATAIQVAGDPGLAPGGDAAATVQLMYVLSGGLWDVGGLFFGLWLVPMGWLCCAAAGCRDRSAGSSSAAVPATSSVRSSGSWCPTRAPSPTCWPSPRASASSGWSATCSSAACARGRGWARS